MRLLPLALLLGCPGPMDPDPTGSPTPLDTDTQPPLQGEDGSLALLRGYDSGGQIRAEIAGVFVTHDQGFLNLGQCLASPLAPCVRALPTAVGTSIPWDPQERFNPSIAQYRYVGLDVRLGPYLGYYEVTETHSWYTQDVNLQQRVLGPYDVRLGVQWGDWRGEDVAMAAPPLLVSAPVPLGAYRVFSDRTDFPIQWEPAPGHELYLFVRDLAGSFGEIHRLEDDGEHAFDLSALGLAGDHDLMFQLQRWTLDPVDVNGNQLVVHTTAETSWAARVIDVGVREPIQPVDTCGGTPPILDAGRYYGDLGGLTDTWQEPVCLPDFLSANGRDGLVAVDLAPHEEVELIYRQHAANAVMYVFDSCEEPPPICLEGVNGDAGQGAEILRLFNPSGTETLRRLVVLDAAEELTGDVFFLDVNRTLVPDPGGSDTCLQALGDPALGPGRYYASEVDHVQADVNPGFTGCTGTTLSGPDLLFPIEVPAGATLELTVQMTGGDPALYLLPQCDDPGTCLAGADAHTTGDEALVWVNSSAATQRVYAVLDTKTTFGPFFLTVDLL